MSILLEISCRVVQIEVSNMSSILLTGGTVITPLETRFCDLYFTDGLISALGDSPDQERSSLETIDVSDCYITPGLVDIQVNGGPRCNFWEDPTEDDVSAMSEDLLKCGVTTILPTLITDDIKHLKKNIQFLKSLGVGSGDHAGLSPNKPSSRAPDKEQKQTGKSSSKTMVRMPGIHLEGPCISPQRPGVHPTKFIQPLSLELVEQISDDVVSLITVAPETDPSGKALEFLQKKKIVVALGHSNATFEEAQKAFDRGVKLMTHTFNALPAVHHRAPGPVAAAWLDESVTCAVICDGLHVAPEAVKLILKMKTKTRMILVTDAAHIGTTGGGLVGSSITLNEAVQNVVKWNLVSFADAIQMATLNPAKILGLQKRIGQVAVGNMADIVAWDKKTLSIKHVFLGGKKIS